MEGKILFGTAYVVMYACTNEGQRFRSIVLLSQQLHKKIAYMLRVFA